MFNSQEIDKIESLSKEYQIMTREALRIQKIIEEAESELVFMVGKIENIKQDEKLFFEDLSVKYDLDTNTLQTMAANVILTGKHE